MPRPLTKAASKRLAAIPTRLAALATVAAASIYVPAPAEPAPRLPMAVGLAPPHVWRVQSAAEQTVISAAGSIAVLPGEDTPLPIKVGPADSVPRNSFVRIRGLPHGAMLSEGFGIAAGLWAVPLNGLPKLRIKLPSALGGETRLTLSLVTVDGKVHAETTIALLPPPAKADRSARLPQETAATTDARAAGGSAETKSSTPSPAGSVETSPAAVDLQQAKALHAQGNQKLASGNVAAARMFYRRAAESGFADAAFALAATYDPEELGRLKVVGLKSDVAAARHWYERARVLGFKGAEERLVRLGAR
jgi:hypothetical protein